jgi:peptide deformylase
MEKMLTIDTGVDVPKQEEITPLNLYTDQHPMMKQVIPDYDLRTLPNPVMNKLVSRMTMTMKLYNGLGLSANQCGVFERVFIMGSGDMVITCINPKAIKVSEEVKKDREGCLSFPAMFLNIDRPEWVEAEFYDINGKLHNVRFDGLTARCFLHELDHMNGITMTQHVKPLALKMANKKRDKLVKTFYRKSKK